MKDLIVKRTDQLQEKLISGVKSKVQRIIFRKIKTPTLFILLKNFPENDIGEMAKHLKFHDVTISLL